MPIEMVFLNIAQAVETFHTRFFYDDSVQKYVDSVKVRYGNSPSFDKVKEILLSGNQENNKSIFLASRINDLLFNSGVRSFYCVGENKDFTRNVVNTRHYYTHYTERRETTALKGQDLKRAILILSLLLEYNICLVLGIDNKDRVQEELKDINTMEQIMSVQN